MPSYRTGEVVTLLQARPGLQRVEVDLGHGPERAYVLTQLTGPVALGDRVVVNTTAVELGLGTGGWHVVHWNLERDGWSEPGPGHIIKGRYTSLQADVGSTEEHLEALAEIDSIDGMPVVVAALHSQLPAVAVAFKECAPDARLAYVMTDGAGLPLAMSDLVATMRDKDLIDATITCGHAFGGDYEAVSVFSALAVARHVAARRRRGRRDGAGDRRHQHPARVQRHGGRPDPRRRERSRRRADRLPARLVRRRTRRATSDSRTTARPRCASPRRDRAQVAVPRLGDPADDRRLRDDLVAAGIDLRHDLVDVDAPDALALFARARSAHRVDGTSGRGRPRAVPGRGGRGRSAAARLAATPPG